MFFQKNLNKSYLVLQQANFVLFMSNYCTVYMYLLMVNAYMYCSQDKVSHWSVGSVDGK